MAKIKNLAPVTNNVQEMPRFARKPGIMGAAMKVQKSNPNRIKLSPKKSVGTLGRMKAKAPKLSNPSVKPPSKPSVKGYKHSVKI